MLTLLHTTTRGEYFGELRITLSMVKVRELTLEERRKVCSLCKDGVTYREVGRAIGCSHSTVARIYKNFTIFGSFEKKARSGRPKKQTNGGANQFAKQ